VEAILTRQPAEGALAGPGRRQQAPQFVGRQLAAGVTALLGGAAAFQLVEWAVREAVGVGEEVAERPDLGDVSV
jgi:hypothetical protein